MTKRFSVTIAAAMTCAIAAPAAAQVRSFNLPAQPAATAIPEFGRQAGVRILVSSDVLAGVRTSAVTGALPVRTALERLLQGTSLQIASDSNGTIVLRAAPVVRPQADSDSGLTDIVVTAQRRDERQQRVPVSLTAFDARQVQDYRLNQLQDISRLTPGLLVSTFSLGSPIIAVRGATNTFSQIGVDKPVGIFVDDVYIARNSAATLELFGIKSIQILKGPQGTLFGRNVTGGAIVIDTGRPEFGEQHLQMRGSYGEYRSRDLDAIVDLPVGEHVALRVAGLLRQRDGWGRDRLTGQELDDQDSKAVRGQLRAELAPSVELLVAGDYATDASNGRTLSSI